MPVQKKSVNLLKAPYIWLEYNAISASKLQDLYSAQYKNLLSNIKIY